MTKITVIILHFALMSIVILSAVEISKYISIANIAPHYPILFLGILVYYNYQIHKAIFALSKKYRNRKVRLAQEVAIITEFLHDKLDYSESIKIQDLISKIYKQDFLSKTTTQFGDLISEQLLKAKRVLEILKHKEAIHELAKKKEEICGQLKTLDYIKKQETQTEEELMQEIKEQMNLDETTVFFKDDLSEQQIEILTKEGYVYSNQYSICDGKNISVFVKPILKHSPTHIFLVWDIIQLLNVHEIENIKEHHTVDADITFKHNNKIYAIEVETGNLLKKQKQLKKKIAYLNRKYGDRWFFVVSNKNLLTQYKKYGIATQRTQVGKTLKKWLKINT